jgi:hypothetical protein
VSASNSCLWSVGFILSVRLAVQLPFDSRQPNPDLLCASLRVLLLVTAAHLVLKFSLRGALFYVRHILSWSLVSVPGQIYTFHISVLLATGWMTEGSEFEYR